MIWWCFRNEACHYVDYLSFRYNMFIYVSDEATVRRKENQKTDEDNNTESFLQVPLFLLNFCMTIVKSEIINNTIFVIKICL
jgi:hypothetical protein